MVVERHKLASAARVAVLLLHVALSVISDPAEEQILCFLHNTFCELVLFKIRTNLELGLKVHVV